MQIVQPPITGTETPTDPSQPFFALHQFYRAFNGRDLMGMANNWAQCANIAMDNPLGGIKRGWLEIGDVYARIFNGPARVYVEFHDYTLHTTQDMFYAVGRERGALDLGDDRIDLHIRTSRIFHKLNGRWRQVHHHGSIDDPALLQRYQALVLGRRN